MVGASDRSRCPFHLVSSSCGPAIEPRGRFFLAAAQLVFRLRISIPSGPSLRHQLENVEKQRESTREGPETPRRGLNSRLTPLGAPPQAARPLELQQYQQSDLRYDVRGVKDKRRLAARSPSDPRRVEIIQQSAPPSALLLFQGRSSARGVRLNRLRHPAAVLVARLLAGHPCGVDRSWATRRSWWSCRPRSWRSWS